MQQRATKRVEALDSFRGISSFLIMVTHFLFYIPEVYQVENLPLIYNGLSWKLPYFFVLSGFVLTLSYQRSQIKRDHPFLPFLVNRIFRIYPVFVLSTVSMFIIGAVFGAGEEIEGASRFFNISWRLTPTFSEFFHTLLMDGVANTWGFNGTAWTLVFEMRYALILPLLLWMLKRNAWLSMILFVVLSGVAFKVSSGIEVVDIFYQVNYQLGHFCTMFNFLLIYVAGMLLALNRDKASLYYCSLMPWGRGVFVAVAIFMLVAPMWIGYIAPPAFYALSQSVAILIGIVMWIVVLLNNEAIAGFFSHRILVGLGRMSFSLYMCHTPVMVLNYMLLRDVLGFGYIIPLSIVESLIIANLSYRYIEQPFIAMGKRLTESNKQ